MRLTRKKILERIVMRIDSCYLDMKLARGRKTGEITAEIFRNRLDELILLYSIIEEISFIEVCNAIGIKYEEVDSQSDY